MRRLRPRGSRKWITVLFVVGLCTIIVGIAVSVAVPPIWQRVCGNSAIAFYGRVVDEMGAGIPGITITFEGSCSDRPAIPLPYGKPDKRWRKTVVTDRSGNFDLEDVFGSSVRGASGSRAGKSIGLAAVGVSPSNDPLYGVTLGERISASRLPNTPQKRLTYKVAPLD